MENFEFTSPTYFAFGRDSEMKTGALAARFGATKVMLHYGQQSAVKSGLLGRVKASLDAVKIPYVELGGVEPNPNADLVYKGIELAKKEDIDFIIAVGGGSAIDSAKAIAAGFFYDGDFWDFFSKPVEAKKVLPVGVVLTISAAGSEGSIGTVITKDGMKRAPSFQNDLYRPKFAIMNPALTASLPPYQVACGGADIMAHLFERYFTNTDSVETTDRLIEGLLLAVISELPKSVANPADFDSAANIMWAGMLAHNNVVGVGRSQDWASHRIEHELSSLYGVAHGAGLATVFPAWMKYVMNHDVRRFARLATNVWGINDGTDTERATTGIKKLTEFWKSVGLPVTLEQLGGKEQDIEFLAKNINYSTDGTIGGFVPLRESDVVEIYKLMR